MAFRGLGSVGLVEGVEGKKGPPLSGKIEDDLPNRLREVIQVEKLWTVGNLILRNHRMYVYVRNIEILLALPFGSKREYGRTFSSKQCEQLRVFCLERPESRGHPYD